MQSPHLYVSSPRDVLRRKRKHITSVSKALNNITCGDLVLLKDSLPILEPNSSLLDAIRTGGHEGCVLVLEDDHEARDEVGDPFMGTVDLYDVLMCAVFNEDCKEPDDIRKKLDSMQVRDAIGTAASLQDVGWHRGVYILNEDHKFVDVVEMMLGGIERVVVNIDDSEDATMRPMSYRLMTQEDAIHYLHSNSGGLRRLESTVGEYERIDDILSASTDISAIDAARRLLIHSRTALALVDEDGVLKGTIDVKDLVPLLLDNIDVIFENVTTIMNTDMATVEEDSTTLDVLEIMATKEVSAVFVVRDLKPINVIEEHHLLHKFSDFEKGSFKFILDQIDEQ